MQWLINMILSLCFEQIGFRRRTVTGGADFNAAALIGAGGWNTHDVSAIVPSGTRAILLRVIARNSFIASRISFRADTDEAWDGLASTYTNVPISYQGHDNIVPLATNRTFMGKVSRVDGWVELSATVAGYWL